MTLSDSDYRINADGYAVAHSSAFVNDSHHRIETSVNGPLYAAAYKSKEETVTVIQVKIKPYNLYEIIKGGSILRPKMNTFVTKSTYLSLITGNLFTTYL